MRHEIHHINIVGVNQCEGHYRSVSINTDDATDNAGEYKILGHSIFRQNTWVLNVRL